MGVDNLVLHASARKHQVENYPGPLSIKAVIRGEVTWIVDARNLAVHEDTFLILNDGQQYGMNIDAPDPVETCCAFFQHGFVEGVARDMTKPLEESLEAPDRAAPPLRFLARLHSGKGTILQRLRSLAARCSEQLQPSSFEEDFLILSQEIAVLHKETAAQLARVPAARKETREELFRRLQVAREFLHSKVGDRTSLEDVAREACLSRFHLHRAFTKTFGETPHAYLTALRLNRARSLLNRGYSVTEASMEVGFSSLSAFSRLFRDRFHISPSSEIRKIGQATR